MANPYSGIPIICKWFIKKYAQCRSVQNKTEFRIRFVMHIAYPMDFMLGNHMISYTMDFCLCWSNLRQYPPSPSLLNLLVSESTMIKKLLICSNSIACKMHRSHYKKSSFSWCLFNCSSALNFTIWFIRNIAYMYEPHVVFALRINTQKHAYTHHNKQANQ